MVATKLFPKFMEGMPKDMSGKVFVITGTTSGTGFVAARTIGKLGGEMVLLNRKSERSTKSLKDLQDAVPDGKFIPIECDLQSFESTQKAADEVKSKYDKIFCLCNNAGIMATPDKATVDGYDTQMQTNHLSHFLLTAELLPLLEKEADESGEARICNHSSFGRLHTPNKGLEEKYFGKNGGNLGGDELKMMAGGCFHRYFQTKLANSVFTYGLNDKLTAKGSKIRAIVAHPGGSDTNLGDHLNMGPIMNVVLRFVTPLMVQSQEDGAMGIIKCMIDPEAESGVLYGPKNGGYKGWPVPNNKEPYENDEAIAMLWRTSEAATGKKLLTD